MKIRFRSRLFSNSFLCVGILVALFLTTQIQAQTLKGQWIGGFSSADDQTGSKTDYILEIETEGKQITGHSYTYFSLSGKRYYVICRLEGSFDKDSKSLVINEVETLKTNTSKDFQNCLQSHQLTYMKQKDRELLLGKWKPSIKGSDCGKGETELERKLIEKIPPQKNNPSIAVTKPIEKKPLPQNRAIPIPPVAKITAPQKKLEDPNTTTAPKILQQENPNSKPLIKVDSKSSQQEESNMGKKISNKEREKLTERTRKFIQTIDVSGPSFRVEIYDNGQVDGDTVTIFLNEILLVPAKKLTTSPITLDIKISDDEDVYDLIMYAENLGTIPPNTALMVVTTSTKRYEINITSTEQTSGAIRFKVKR